MTRRLNSVSAVLKFVMTAKARCSLHTSRGFLWSRGPDRGLEKEVEATRITIGTAASNDLQLTDPTVSRRHCEISVREERYFIRDLGSTNGTGVNGTPVVEAILAPGRSYSRWRLGDSVRAKEEVGAHPRARRAAFRKPQGFVAENALGLLNVGQGCRN